MGFDGRGDGGDSALNLLDDSYAHDLRDVQAGIVNADLFGVLELATASGALSGAVHICQAGVTVWAHMKNRQLDRLKRTEAFRFAHRRLNRHPIHLVHRYEGYITL